MKQKGYEHALIKNNRTISSDFVTLISGLKCEVKVTQMSPYESEF